MAGNLDNLSGTRFLATQTFPIGQSYAGWQIDGLSGLDYDDARNTFIAVRDNAYTGGPNGRNTPPYFSLTPIFSAGTPGYTLQFSGVTPLDTAAWMPGMRGLESVRHDPDGDGLWFTSEEPHTVYHVRADGVAREQLTLSDIVTGRFAPGTNNYGLEGLTFTPDKGLWVIRENALQGDSPNLTRITRLDRDGTVAAQYAYRLDSLSAPNNGNRPVANPPASGVGNNGAAEILALTDTRFLVLERAWDGIGAEKAPQGVSHNAIRIYQVDFGTATDVSKVGSLVDNDPAILPASKQILFDSADLASTLATYDTKIDNIEGMSLGPVLPNGQASLVLVSDSNARAQQRKTQFVVLELETPVPEIQRWDGDGAMADGATGGGPGTWSTATDRQNWTRADGRINDAWAGRTALFSGTGGTVSIDAQAGPVSAAALRFESSGYRIAGDALTLGSSGITIDAGGAGVGVTIASVLAGAGGLALTGTGTTTLEGANTYTGMTRVSAGTLLVNGSSGRSGTTVGAGATLGGIGSLGAVSVEDGGALAPGSTVGVLRTGDVRLASGATLSLDLNGTGAGSGYDQVAVTGSVSLDGAALDLRFGSFTAKRGDSFVVVDNDGTEAITGANGTGTPSLRYGGAILTEGSSFSANGRSYRLSFQGGSGDNDVTLTDDTAAPTLREHDVGKLLSGFDDIRKEHADLLARNLQAVKDIMAASTPAERAAAQADDRAYSTALVGGPALGGLNAPGMPYANADGTGWAVNDAAGNEAAKAKAIFDYPRPFLADPSIEPLVGGSGGSLPSGHTSKGFAEALYLAYIFPERFQQIMTRASEYGEHRIVNGVHYPLDVIAGRMVAAWSTAGFLDPSNNPVGSANVRNTALSVRKAMSDALAGSGQTIAQKAASGPTDRFSDYATNKADWNGRLTYGLPDIGSTDQPITVPSEAAYLLATRFPYLGLDQIRDILASTALPSGGVMDNGNGWARLDLFRAADGYARLATDTIVTMDAAASADDTRPGAAFNAADLWRNDIAGPGTLTKNGSGTLTLAGGNSFAGIALNGGGLTLTGENRLTGSSRVAAGVLTASGRLLSTGGDLIVGKEGKLRLGLTGLGETGLSIGGTVEASGTVVLDGAADIGLAGTGTVSGSISGTGSLTKSGSGRLSLSGANTYAGGTMLAGGTLELASVAAAGAGIIRFGTGAQTLRLDLPGTYANRITGFDLGDAIDLQGLAYDKAGPLVYDDATGRLNLGLGSQATSLSIDPARAGAQFAVASDADGSTLLTLQQEQSPPPQSPAPPPGNHAGGTGTSLTTTTDRAVAEKAAGRTVQALPDNFDKAAVEQAVGIFLAGLPQGTNLNVSAFTPTPGATDIRVAGPGDGTRMVVTVDASSVPPGTSITLDNVDFVVLSGPASLVGGAGAQTVFGDDAAQSMVLGADDDTLHGGGGNDVVGSKDGNDLLYGDAGDDTVFGGIGADTVSGGADRDIVYGNQDADLIYGNQDADTLYGGQGDDRAYAGQGDDRLFGNAGSDVLSGNRGADLVYGNQGADAIYGNQGADTLYGGQDEDTLFGGQDDDVVYGNLGADALFGNLGADTLYGGQGADTLIGGPGDDLLVGGLGADLYLFGPNAGRDVIVGLDQAGGDRISLGGQPYTVGATQNGDALLTLVGGGTVLLAGIRAGQVGPDLFVA